MGELQENRRGLISVQVYLFFHLFVTLNKQTKNFFSLSGGNELFVESFFAVGGRERGKGKTQRVKDKERDQDRELTKQLSTQFAPTLNYDPHPQRRRRRSLYTGN